MHKQVVAIRLMIWLFAVGLGCLLALPVSAQDDQVVGSVSRLQGQAQVVRAGQAAIAVAQGDDVLRSDRLITLENALVEVLFSDGSSFTLDENAQVTIAQYAPGAAPQGLLQLTRGRLRSRVSSAFSSRKDSYQVQTREGVMGVQGTEFEVIAALRETSVIVYSGVVSATSLDPAFPGTQILQPGQMLSIRAGEPMQPPVQASGLTQAAAGMLINAAIGSGGAQAIISGGFQAFDPTAPALTRSDQPAGPGGTQPPPPRPPGG